MKHSEGLLLPLLLAVLPPLPWQGRRDATAGDCVRHRDALVISKHKSSLGIVDELHSAVDDLQKGGRVPPHLGVLLQEQVIRASRGLCRVQALAEEVGRTSGSTTTSSPPGHPQGRITRRRRRRQLAVGLAAGLITAGLLKLGPVVESLLLGNSYSAQWNNYMKRTARSEHEIKLRINKMLEKIESLEQAEAESMIIDEVQSIISLLEVGWADIEGTSSDIRTNNILSTMYAVAEKHYIKLDLAEKEMTKIRIPMEARRLQIEFHEAPRCSEAHVDITTVVAVPSKSCYKVYEVDNIRNVTYLESEFGCVVVGRMDNGVQLSDETLFILSNAWISKGVSCQNRDKDVIIHSLGNDVYVGGAETHDLVSNCDRKFRETTRTNVTSVPAATCSGRISFYRRGSKISWQEFKTRVIGGTAGVTARYSGLEFGLEWFHTELKDVLDKIEKDDNINLDEDYDDYEGNDIGWAPAIGGGTGLVLIAGSAVISFRIWSNLLKCSDSHDDGDYHREDGQGLDGSDNGTHRPSAEFRRLDKNIKCLNQIRLDLENIVKQEEEDSEDEEDIDEEEDSE